MPTRTLLRCRLWLFISMVCSGVMVPSSAWSQAADRPANRLARETSPYLLLHAHNPVDWYPWGPEAFAKAKAEKKPIFLSVGYSSCYWCHVMERESFEDAEIAKALNARFVCIKVDREERPDVDQIYMAALQALTGRGGWPMSMVLTPDGRPFFGGTYFPPRAREGSSGFLQVVDAVADAWRDHRLELEKTANALTGATRKQLQTIGGVREVPLTRDWAAEGQAELARQFDPRFGGFGFNPGNPRRPKFPEPVNLVFLLDRHLRRPAGKAGAGADREGTDPLEMVRLTLDRMAAGGIRDHLGGGYHRYSTDRSWTVPHFEKMLYDNAQLASAYLLAFVAMDDLRWRAEAESIFEYIDKKMTSDEGGFYSSLDAETNREEGAYYVWTPEQVKAVLGGGADAVAFAKVYGLDGEPNFEGGRFVLLEPKTRAEQAEALKTTPKELEARLAPLRARLLAAREKRPSPMRDDKILTGWNGLMIAAYADGYRVLHVEKYRQAAERAADFLLTRLRGADGRLLRTYRLGKAKLPAYLEDYAFLAHGLIQLHAATSDARWLREARTLVDRMIADFEDRELGGFFYTAEGHESLLARPKDPFDNALPGANSMAILDLLAIHRATGESSYRDHAAKALGAFSSTMSERAFAMPMMLMALERYLDLAPDATKGGALIAGSPKPAAPSVVVASVGPIGPTSTGREVDAVISVTIQEGWHIYANPTKIPELKPTTLKLASASEGAATLADVMYPAGESKILGSTGAEKVPLYEGTVKIKARIRVAADAKPGSKPLKFELSYQACNDRLCLAPARLEIPVEITVVR